MAASASVASFDRHTLSDTHLPQPRHRVFAALYGLGERLESGRLAPHRELVCGGASGRVLEIGCGTGANFSHYAWARLDALEASEPDPFMLRRAQKRATRLASLAQEKLRIVQAPAEFLPFEDASFDCVVSTLVLCSVESLDAALNEIARVLRPGGELRFLEHVAGHGLEARVQRVFQPAYGWLAAGCQLTRHTEEALRAASFEVSVQQRLRFGPLFPVIRGVAKKPVALA